MSHTIFGSNDKIAYIYHLKEKKYSEHSPYIVKILFFITKYIACKNAEISEKYYTTNIRLFKKNQNNMTHIF